MRLLIITAVAAVALVPDLSRAAASETNRATGRQEQQVRAREWLATNTVAAGRSRGGEVVRRALLVGINTYEPTAAERAQLVTVAGGKTKKGRGNFTDLDGCVNDVEAMRVLLIARFGFKPEHIMVLTNRQATRAAILTGIEKHLAASARAGDVAFFFYAGHGSQIVNSKSDEQDKRDETIVPADSWNGTPDIRDKELRRYFNTILEKHAVLTAVFDSCHSGSTARGNPVPRKTRHAEPILDDLADGTDYGRSPEERGALVISAAQDDQFAEESSGEVPHGAFTAALLSVLRHMPLTRTVTDIFLAVSSALQAEGRNQIPVLSGVETRRQQGLFGDPTGLSGRIAVGVLSVNPSGMVSLQGGRAAGLTAGCQLQQLVSDTNQTPVVLEITSVNSLVSSEARLVTGNSRDVRAGVVFEVSRWVVAPEAMLNVWLPPGGLTASQFQEAVRLAGELSQSGQLEWVTDPTEVSPTHLLTWDGRQWSLGDSKSPLAQFDAAVGATVIHERLAKLGSRPKLFMSFPIEADLRRELSLGESSSNNAVAIVATPQRAHYSLTGTYRDGRVRYAWMLPNVTGSGAVEMPLPARTDWCPTNGQADISAKAIAGQMASGALQLGRIRSWLTLAPTDDAGQFPYRLALKNLKTGALITGNNFQAESSTATGSLQLRPATTVVTGGERFSLVLHAEPEALKQAFDPRFVYVFTLDSAGGSTLLWPRGGQGNSQRFPPTTVSGGGLPPEIPLNVRFSVTEPFGLDTYILLTSVTAIPDATVLEFDPVRRRSGGSERGSSHPLQRLLGTVGSATRSAKVEVPADWSIERLAVRSVAAPAQP